MSDLFFALLLGLASGLMPGPIFAFMVSETLQHGPKRGLMMACAPLPFALIAVPIILLSLTFLKSAPWLLASMGLIGGVLILRIGLRSIQFKPPCTHAKAPTKIQYWYAALVNFCCPDGYIFWMTVGAALVHHAQATNRIFPWLFVTFYYASIVGTKLVIILLTNAYKTKIVASHYYQWLMRIIGFLILCFALKFFWMNGQVLWHALVKQTLLS